MDPGRPRPCLLPIESLDPSGDNYLFAARERWPYAGVVDTTSHDTAPNRLGDGSDGHGSLPLAPVERLLAPAIVLPWQLIPLRTAVPDHDGPRRLMLAVLRDAVHLLTTVRARGRGDSEEVGAALAWVESSDRTALFAFERICEELAIDPSYVRRGVAAWAEGMRPVIRRRRRRRAKPGLPPAAPAAAPRAPSMRAVA